MTSENVQKLLRKVNTLQLYGRCFGSVVVQTVNFSSSQQSIITWFPFFFLGYHRLFAFVISFPSWIMECPDSEKVLFSEKDEILPLMCLPFSLKVTTPGVSLQHLVCLQNLKQRGWDHLWIAKSLCDPDLICDQMSVFNLNISFTCKILESKWTLELLIPGQRGYMWFRMQDGAMGVWTWTLLGNRLEVSIHWELQDWNTC